jgi:hypothetical protein
MTIKVEFDRIELRKTKGENSIIHYRISGLRESDIPIKTLFDLILTQKINKDEDGITMGITYQPEIQYHTNKNILHPGFIEHTRQFLEDHFEKR